ncbi:MAG: hypothetical protein ACK55Z_34120, partial [bacterium]
SYGGRVLTLSMSGLHLMTLYVLCILIEMAARFDIKNVYNQITDDKRYQRMKPELLITLRPQLHI